MRRFSMVNISPAMELSCSGHRAGDDKLCVTQSRYTCGGSYRGNPLASKDSDGKSCVHDGTDERNLLPKELCLTKLVPSLAERFQPSAQIACERPMYELRSPTSPLGSSLGFAYLWYAVSLGLLAIAICANLTIGYKELPEGGDGI